MVSNSSEILLRLVEGVRCPSHGFCLDGHEKWQELDQVVIVRGDRRGVLGGNWVRVQGGSCAVSNSDHTTLLAWELRRACCNVCKSVWCPSSAWWSFLQGMEGCLRLPGVSDRQLVRPELEARMVINSYTLEAQEHNILTS